MGVEGVDDDARDEAPIGTPSWQVLTSDRTRWKPLRVKSSRQPCACSTRAEAEHPERAPPQMSLIRDLHNQSLRSRTTKASTGTAHEIEGSVILVRPTLADAWCACSSLCLAMCHCTPSRLMNCWHIEPVTMQAQFYC